MAVAFKRTNLVQINCKNEQSYKKLATSDWGHSADEETGQNVTLAPIKDPVQGLVGNFIDVGVIALCSGFESLHRRISQAKSLSTSETS